MFDITEIVEFAKSKGFDIKQSENLGITSFLELRPSEKLITEYIYKMKNNPYLFFDTHFNSKLTSGQLRCLNKSRFFDHFLISGERRSGKSTLSLFWAIKSAILYKKSVVLVCPTNKIADSMFNMLLIYMNQCPTWLCSITEQSRPNTRLKLNNGGSIDITSLKKDTLIGKRADSVILDDVSEFDSLELDEFYLSIWPVISSTESELIITSSSDVPKSPLFDELVFKSQMGLSPFVVEHLKQIK